MKKVCCHCENQLSTQGGLCRICRKRVIINDRFIMTKYIGSGGFGRVYEAWETRTNTRCAVKQVEALTNEHWELIEQEARILKAKLAGIDFVPSFYGAWQYGSTIYIVMQYIEGKTLDTYAKAYWHPDRVRRFLLVMLSHLQKLHELGVIHRDIKPNNIIRTSNREYILLDFGIAKHGTTTQTVVRGVGTVAYMPYEQMIAQTTTPQSDLYSLGVTCYQLLTGKLPPRVDHRLSGAKVTPPNMIVNGVPENLNNTIMALLELYPSHRPVHAQAARAMMLGRPHPVPIPPPKTIIRPPNKALHISGDVFGALFLVVLVAAVVFFITVNIESSSPQSTGIGATNVIPTGRIAFSTKGEDSYDIFIADANGGSPLNRTNSPEDEYAPAWSGDGTYIVFVAKINSDYAIGRVDVADGRHRVLTTPEPGINFGTPAPSPDGGLIAYNSGPNGNFDLYLMNADGTNQRLLVAGPQVDYCPSWLPDGQRLVFIQQRGELWNLQLVNLQGDENVTIYSSPSEIRFAAVSPDGTQIAVAMYKNNNWDIYSIPLSGGEPRRLTSHLADESNPTWSPDGTKVMFMSSRDSEPRSHGYGQLYMISAQGGIEQRVFAERADDRHPAWLP
jgi:serine/threonine protein kinase